MSLCNNCNNRGGGFSAEGAACRTGTERTQGSHCHNAHKAPPLCCCRAQGKRQASNPQEAKPCRRKKICEAACGFRRRLCRARVQSLQPVQRPLRPRSVKGAEKAPRVLQARSFRSMVLCPKSCQCAERNCSSHAFSSKVHLSGRPDGTLLHSRALSAQCQLQWLQVLPAMCTPLTYSDRQSISQPTAPKCQKQMLRGMSLRGCQANRLRSPKPFKDS